MSALRTQLVSDKPQVLLLSYPCCLQREIKKFLERNDLEVVIKPPEFALSGDVTNFYKIIYLFNWQDGEKWVDVGAASDAALTGHCPVLTVAQISSLDKNFAFLQKNQNIIIGQDVILPGNANWPVLKFITRDINLKNLLDPKIDLYLQSADNFFHKIKDLVLSPQDKQVLIQGKKQTSSAVVKEIKRLYEHFHDADLGVKVLIQKNAVGALHATPLQIIKSNFENLPDLLTESVGLLPGPKATPVVKAKPVVKKTPVATPAPVVKKTYGTGTPVPHVKKNTPVVKKKASKPQPQPTQVQQEIDQRLSEIFQSERVEEKVEHVKELVKDSQKVVKKSKRRQISFYLGLFFTILASLLIVLISLFFFSNWQVKRQLTNFAQDQGNLKSLSKSAQFLAKQNNLYAAFLPAEFLTKSQNLVEISQALVELENKGQTLQQQVLALSQSFLGNSAVVADLDMAKTAALAKDLYNTLSQLQSRLKGFLEASELFKDLNQKREALIFLQQIEPSLDELLGVNEKKTYALLLQNNQELRATGGFIQAVALLTVNQGMMIDYQVFSSYELDNRLSGDVVPPEEIVSLLGENKWFLRDSNWDADFSVSGKQIAWFLEQEINRKIDGVFALNLLTLEDWLKATGPLELPEFNETLTDRNLPERAEFHSEVKLVDSEDHVDYLSKVLERFLLKLTKIDPDSNLSFLQAVYNSLQEKQFLMYFADKSLQNNFSSLGWTGQLWQPQCPSELSTLPCQVDSLAIVDSNIGINKANYHTKRQDTHLVEINQEQVRHSRTITFDNQAYSNAWPKGSYKSYLRFYLPAKAESLSVQINGQNVPEEQLQISKSAQNIKIGLVTTTPIQQETVIALSYILPIESTLPSPAPDQREGGQAFSYVFFDQKQAGLDDVLEQLTFKFDPKLTPSLIAPQAEVQGSNIIFKNQDQDHFFVGVSFK